MWRQNKDIFPQSRNLKNFLLRKLLEDELYLDEVITQLRGRHGIQEIEDPAQDRGKGSSQCVGSRQLQAYNRTVGPGSNQATLQQQHRRLWEECCSVKCIWSAGHVKRDSDGKFRTEFCWGYFPLICSLMYSQYPNE